MSERTRDEHLAWAKARALQYVDAGDLVQAVTSMGSDLTKHSDWSGKILDTLMYVGLIFEIPRGADAVRRWINGFN